MKALISIVCGLFSLGLILWAQSSAYAIGMLNRTDIGFELPGVDWKLKMISVSVALISLAYSIYYTKSGQLKMRIVNRVGRLLAILAIILCIIPVYKVLLR